MTPRGQLDRRMGRMEHDRRSFLAWLSALPAAMLERSPSAGAWSVAQAVAHLAMVEEGMLAYMAHKLKHGRPGPPGFGAPIRLLLLNSALVSPFRFKAPPMVSPMPAVAFGDAVARWDHARKQLMERSRGLPEDLLDRALFKHPSAGRFTMAQGLSFLSWHARRHMRQVRLQMGRTMQAR